ncbi:MAG: hypothetical protein IIA63_07815 [Nitrospinae bacterium]|nr:hypothetical protein [Nitrospinota bacterium]
MISIKDLIDAWKEIGALKSDLRHANAEIARLRGYRNTKKKHMKPKHRQRLGHLKLIAVNGVPVSNKN